jgi:hypothetical protein
MFISETVLIDGQLGVPFQIGGRHGSGIREFMNDVDMLAFLKREPVEFGVDRYW